ncbi:hypothetical protein BH11ACT2_BH11ACT2_05440 [soil metagenome]
MTTRGPSAGWAWGIRAGFRDYFAALDDSEVELRGVSWDAAAEQWRWPSAGGSLLRFRAHAGALDIAIADAAIEQRAGDRYLVHAGGIALARLLDDPTTDENGTTSYEDVALTVDGSALFGGIYSPWARMEPVHVFS